MRQFSLTQLLMFVALVAILLTLARSEGCGYRRSMIGSLEFSADGKRLLVARYDDHNAGVPNKGYVDEICRTISVIDVESGTVTSIVDQVVKSYGSPVVPPLRAPRTAFAEDDKAALIEELNGGELKLCDLETRQWRTPFAGHQQYSFGFVVSRNQKVVATSYDDAVELWDAKAGNQLLRIVAGCGPNLTPLVGLSADGELVATCGSAGLQLWNVSDGTQLRTTSSIPAGTRAIGFSPVGHTLAFSQSDRICLYDVDRNQTRDVPWNRMYSSIAFSADGNRLAVAAANRDEVMFVDGITGRALDRLSSPYLTSIAISPDGNRIAIGDYGGSLRLWSPGRGSPPKQIVVPGRTNAYTWPLPFAALVIWAGICYWIWVRRKRAKEPQATPSAASDTSS